MFDPIFTENDVCDSCNLGKRKVLSEPKERTM